MTDDLMKLRALVEKSADADLLREMIGFVAEKLMEVGAATGAAWGEKSPLRPAQRNGYRDRDWRRGPAPSSCAFRSSGGGRLLPRLPRTAPHGREGADSRHPGGLSAGHLGALGRRSGQGDGMSGISKSQVSRLCEEIDGKVKTFLERPIEGD